MQSDGGAHLVGPLRPYVVRRSATPKTCAGLNSGSELEIPGLEPRSTSGPQRLPNLGAGSFYTCSGFNFVVRKIILSGAGTDVESRSACRRVADRCRSCCAL